MDEAARPRAVEPNAVEYESAPIYKKPVFIIGVIVILAIIGLFLGVFFLMSSKVGFSEDIPAGFKPSGEIESVIDFKAESYNSLAADVLSPLKEAVQNGKVNILMTNDKGTEIVDAMGLTVENGLIVKPYVVKVNDPSFDAKFTRSFFYSVIGNPPNRNEKFLEGYDSGDVQIKAYGSENKKKIDLLDEFVAYFFV
ncbi:MAG: hypothetical protein KKA79_00710 [Nanoarchaeota archaeon]|nr:hypothetical protein [Nanoarchaeota archaeon]MCG2719011.1 hypothetical protein [Nanoarchaeota archaeon]